MGRVIWLVCVSQHRSHTFGRNTNQAMTWLHKYTWWQNFPQICWEPKMCHFYISGTYSTFFCNISKDFFNATVNPLLSLHFCLKQDFVNKNTSCWPTILLDYFYWTHSDVSSASGAQCGFILLRDWSEISIYWIYSYDFSLEWYPSFTSHES